MGEIGPKGAAGPEQIGAYTLVRKLGSGDTFLALDHDKRQVVLKVIAVSSRNQSLLDPRIIEKATAYARLSHPNIVRVADLFSTEGRFVAVFEHIDGSTLNVVQAGLRRKGADFTDDAAFHIAHSLYSAIAHAHEAQDSAGHPAPVLHRNVNPTNVFIDWTGHVKLGHFSIANVALLVRDSQPSLTWGSYGYLAPEQVRGEAMGPAADVYAATLVFWELLTRRKAIARDRLSDAQLLESMAAPSLPALDSLRPELDPRIAQAVCLALEPDPAKRTATAAAMRDIVAQATSVASANSHLAQALKQIRTHVVAGIGVPRPDGEPPPSNPEEAGAEPHEKAASPPAAAPRAWLYSATLRPAAAPKGALPSLAPRLESIVESIFPITRLRARIRKVRRAAVAAMLAVVLAIAGVAAFAGRESRVERVQIGTHRPNPAAQVPTPSLLQTKSPIEPQVPPAAQVASTPASPSSPSPSSTMGTLTFAPSAAGHRIFIDGHVVGEGAAAIHVRCGPHTVRVGSGGTPQTLEVPCDDSIDVPTR